MSRRAALIAAVLCALGFLIVLALVWAGVVVPADRAVRDALRGSQHPVIVAGGRLAEVAMAITWGGAWVVRAPIALGGVVVMAAWRKWRDAALLASAWTGGVVLVEVLKPLIGRARPDIVYRIVPVTEASFPSGHSAGAMILYPLLGALLGGVAGPRGLRTGLIIGILPALAIGLTRPILGVHWASDVLGGWLLGGAVAALALAFTVERDAAR